MKPSEKIKEILSRNMFTASAEPSAYEDAIILYLDEEYDRTEKNHCDCHACPNKS